MARKLTRLMDRGTSPSGRAIAYAVSYSIVPQLVFWTISDLPAARFMRETLHLDAKGFALLGTLCGLPGYLGPAYGYVRDRWSPFGLGDRGFLVVLPLLGMLGFILLALLPFGYGNFLGCAWLVQIACNFLVTALNGASAGIVKKYDVSTQFVAASSFAGAVMGAATSLAGGWAAMHIPYRLFLWIMGGGCVLVSLYGLYRPKGIDLPKTENTERLFSPKSELKRLVRCKPFVRIFIFSVVWSIDFTVGGAIIYFIQDKLHGTMEDVGRYNAVNSIVGWIAIPLYAIVASRFQAKSIMFFAIFAATFQYLPLLYSHSMLVAYAASAVLGLTNCLMNLPKFDLQIRHCPPGAEGLAFALLNFCFGVVGAVSGIVGSWMYDRYGFGAIIWATVIASAVAIPLLAIVQNDAPPTLESGQILEGMTCG